MRRVIPEIMSEAAKQGMERVKVHRKNRAMLIRAYVGQYFAEREGLSGKYPINLVYNAIRSIVPQYIMKNPLSQVTSDIMEYDDYSYLLGKALDHNNRRIKKKQTLRAGLVDAMFSMAIFKTSLCDSGSTVKSGDKRVDNGVIFTDLVSLDDFVPDPDCRSFDKATFLGDKVRVPRQLLMDNDEFNRDLVLKLPRSSPPQSHISAEKLSKLGINRNQVEDMQDFVDIIYLYVPSADAIVVIPDPYAAVFPDFLAVHDYYGPKDGPYTFMSLSQPVPDNPFPVAPAAMWYDLNEMANQMMRKLMEQAARQKSVGIYDATMADEVEDIKQAEDGALVQGDPQSINVLEFGGQNRESEQFVNSLSTWFNYMAGNPDQLAGHKQNAKTATQSQILASNAAVGLEDGKDILYDTAAELSRKEAWYMHHDPLINIPIPHRQVDGSGIQLHLTPDQRQGSPEEYIFKIKAKSMEAKEPGLVAKQILEFSSSVIPSVMNSAMIAMQMGQAFNVPRALSDIADKMGILEEVHDWFSDPDFQRKIELHQLLSPQGDMKAQQGGGSGGMGAVMQNGGVSNVNQQGAMSPFQQQKSGEQDIANLGQSAQFRGGY